MFTTTLTTLAAAAALHAQVFTANTPAAANTVSTPTVTAIATAPKIETRRGAHIPGNFTVTPETNPLEGLDALYVVRSGDGG